ncbi:ATP-binding protein [bacterium]|nr:MAG: ATP-binding protein [bacterium]
MLLQRTEYIDRLLKLRDKNVIKVITGVRRSGKSTLLSIYRSKLEESGVSQARIQTYNYEDPRVNDMLDWREIYHSIESKLVSDTKNYVFLDEIQVVPEFEKLVDGLFIHDDIDLYITGSNAFLLSSELATLLSGRYISTHVLPLSFAEYSQAFPDENRDRVFERYLNSSTLPETIEIAEGSPELVADYVRDVYQTVVQKDIRSRFAIRDMDNFEKVVKFAFDNIGNLVSAKSIADALNAGNTAHQQDISHKTVTNYLEYLTTSYLLYKADRYDIKGKQLLKTQEKYYAVDLGLRSVLLGQRTDIDLGHKLENIVYLELRRRNNGHILVGKSDSKEVDFVVQNTSDDRQYYQVALTVKDEKTLARELEPLQRIRDNYQKILLTTDYDDSVYEGIRKINVVDWLLTTE